MKENKLPEVFQPIGVGVLFNSTFNDYIAKKKEKEKEKKKKCIWCYRVLYFIILFNVIDYDILYKIISLSP